MEKGCAEAALKILIVIAHYNHTGTLRRVVQRCREVWPQVLVVDDGSAVAPQEVLQGLDVSWVQHPVNLGKGCAILTGAAWAQEHGFTHIITLDADGQHDPAEIPLFVQRARQVPGALIVGVRKFDASVPFGSQFGRQFGNFWVRVQTGKAVRDIQSGYRCYPVEMLRVLNIWSKRYAFEVEVVVRALWAGFAVEEVDISVTYGSDRISHFSQWKDNLRLTVLNTYLTIRSMVPLAHRRYKLTPQGLIRQDYGDTLRANLTAPGSVVRNALSAAWGIFCGTIAFPGVRQMWLFGGAGWWNLNRLVCISFEKLCVGPFAPALCVEVGYFLRHGQWLTEFNMTTLGRQIGQRVWEWILGSLVVAPTLAILTFCIVAVVGWVLRRSLREHA